MTTKMKAVIYRQYGGPEVLEVVDLPLPDIGPDQVLVRVKATGLNPKDVAIRSGFLKLISGRRFPKGTGFDFSGVVEKTGAEVKDYRHGDEVFGYLEDLNGGAAAEYLAVSQNWIARKPPSVSHEVMAAVPCAYLTAWQALVQKANLQKGQKVLICGASGGVGTAAVQIARFLGAEVTAVSSKRNSAYCLQQGAHQALAYDDGDFARDLSSDYDFFFQVHVLSGSLYPVAKKVLKPAGIFVTLDPGPGAFLRSLASRILPGPSFRNLLVKSKKEDLSALARLAGEGVLKPFLQQILPLDNILQAHAQLESGHTTGKVVLVIPDSPDDAEKGEVSEEKNLTGV